MFFSREKRKIRREREAFASWRRENPGRKYSDYYVDWASARLAAGRSHASLGMNPRVPDAREASGKDVFHALIERGLRPQHTCVDYGCGSLRLGRHLMRYLAPGRYWGVDVTWKFIDLGLRRIEPAILREKRPNLALISERTLEAIERCEPDFVISHAVLPHVPPFELDEYLRNLMRTVGKRTRAFVSVHAAADIVHWSPRRWAYPIGAIEDVVGELGGRTEYVREKAWFSRAAKMEIERGTLTIIRVHG